MYNKNVYKYDDMKRQEHMAVRKTAGWYLFTHKLVEVTGKDAAAFLDYICPNPIGNLKPGKERYTVILDEKGEIIDDVVIFRRGEQEFWISTLFTYYMMPWFAEHKGDYKVECKDITETLHMYAVQGPKSPELVNSLVKKPVDDLKFFSFADNVIDGVPVIVNRAGFTGEKFGYEIYIAADKADFLEGKLKEAAKKVNAREVTDAQIMAWTLPTEAGLYYMRDLRHCTPFEVGLANNINWDKEFVGKKALLPFKEGAEPAREMVGFTLAEADVRITGKDYGGPGGVVSVDGEEVGRVSKLNYSYVLEKPVGYILARKGAMKVGDHVTINDKYDALIIERPFI
jgi:aminomethyltransferase